MSNTPVATDSSDRCLKNCLEEVKSLTQEQLIQMIATLKAISMDDVADKLRGYTNSGLRKEYCHLRCVSDYEPVVDPQTLPGNPFLDLDPPEFK